MTLFINLRATSVGGLVAADASAWDGGMIPVSPGEFSRRGANRDLVLATHGFNVDQQDGIDALTAWERVCPMPSSSLFVGVLWPGDSRLHVFVDYVYEGVEAIASGKLLATYLNANATQANRVSMASHSLGARVVLEAVRWLRLELSVRELTLMAGAIENDCLAREYADVARRVTETAVIASQCDAVLEWAFPAGNLIGEILMHGHPYDRTALGRRGPARPLPADTRIDPWQAPDNWDYGHLDYLPEASKGAPLPPNQMPVDKPGDKDPEPTANPAGNWKPGWSAGVLATKSR